MWYLVAVGGGSAGGDQIHVDGAGDWVHGSGLHRDLHQPLRLEDVLLHHRAREAHARVGLGKADQT